jgi:methionyl-tRNA formyltransferase
MNIVFIGTVEFSYKTLEKIISLNGNITGVCTKKNSKFNSDYYDLTPLCHKNNIQYHYTDDINSKESLNWIKSCSPDIIFCFGWSSLIKKELLNLAPMGVVGFPPSALPQYRGRQPIIWSLVLGLDKSASTFFFMDEGADSGDILSQKSFEIKFEDDAASLYKKIVSIALIQIETFLPLLQNKKYPRIKQNHIEANIWRKRNKKDGEIDFRMSSLSIYNLVRALTKPYVGAHLIYKNTDIKIWKVEIIDYRVENIESGKVLNSEEDFILVKTNDGAIKIIDHDFKEKPKPGEYL